ncbi:MAG: response regulator [Oligoflexia bacterium]|nr:response regulator [Oligoflexia bacterium]
MSCAKNSEPADLIRLLVIEDSEDDYLMLVRELSRAGLEHESTRVDSEEAFKRALDQSWDIIISDYNVPGFGGLHALSIVRKREMDIPFILMSGTIGEDIAVEAMRTGAQDYIMKGHSARLVPAISRELKEAELRRRTQAELREREEQLRQAQKMEAIGQLAGGLAHDFNNILAVIGCHVDMILKSAEDVQAVRAGAESIEHAQDRASALVRNLLAFSRKQALAPRNIDLNSFLRGAENVLQLAVGKGNELVIELDPEIPGVLADPVQIEQILMNFAVNARDAMPEGGRLTIRTTHEGSGSESNSLDRVLLTVADTGCGMDPSIMSRIFEPFFTTKEVGKGSGLGLSTVFGIVKQLEGEITVDSKPGMGTIFRIYFPGMIGDEQVSSETSVSGASPKPSDGTVLVVEDDARLRKALSNILRNRGYLVFEAGNGEEALSLGKDSLEALDLVIADVDMSEGSEPAFIRELGKLQRTVKFLCISGYSDRPTESLGDDGKRIHFLQKPFNGQTLLSRIDGILRKGDGAEGQNRGR